MVLFIKERHFCKQKEINKENCFFLYITIIIILNTIKNMFSFVNINYIFFQNKTKIPVFEFRQTK